MLFLLLLSPKVRSDSGEKILTGFDVRNDLIADNYEAGPFLIYDCLEKHWTCVTESYWKGCQEKMQQDLTHKNNVMVTCAPLEEFPNKRSCFQRQLFLTSNNHGTGVCIVDGWKEKEIKY